MNDVLVFNTASEYVTDKLLSLLKNENVNIFCAVQTDNTKKFCEKYGTISIIDINKSNFSDLPESTVNELRKRRYKCVYIPIAGLWAYHYGNIMKIVSALDYDSLCFFNSDGNLYQIGKISDKEEIMYRRYIELFRKIYRLIGR